MSSSTFTCQIVGRLGSDAKVNKIGENNAISFSVAISERKGEENVTSWINCTYWSKSQSAQKMAGHLNGKTTEIYTIFKEKRELEELKKISFK